MITANYDDPYRVELPCATLSGGVGRVPDVGASDLHAPATYDQAFGLKSGK